jgi:hypothetical protein
MEALRHLLGNGVTPTLSTTDNEKKSRLDSLLRQVEKSIKSKFVRTTGKKAKPADLPTDLQTSPSSSSKHQ